MSAEEKIEAVKKIDKALNKQPVELEVERVSPNKEHFDSLMSTDQNRNTVETKKIEESALTIDKTKPSLMDQVKALNTKVNTIGQLSPEDLKNQVRDIATQLETIKTEIGNSKGIKPSYHTLMEHRLTHIDDNLKVALSKAGIEYKQVAPTTLHNTQLNPMDRFLGYITHGQYQLEHLGQTIANMSDEGKRMTPENMLSLQIKVGQIQQEIELFTSLLNKALESTKTLMNVQV